MKKLLPLLLFAVGTMLVSCEKHEPTPVTAQFPTIRETLTIESDLVVKLELNQPAPENLSIPFEITGDAEEYFDYVFVGSNDNSFHVAKGSTEGSFTLRHLERNGIGKDVYVKLREGSGYALGSNYICQLLVAPRTPVYVNFTATEIPGREFSTVDIEIEVGAEDPAEPFVAPEDLVIPITIIGDYEISNILQTGWLEWATANYPNSYYDTIIIPSGETTGSTKMRLGYANNELPGDLDPEYRLGFTFPAQKSLKEKGYILREDKDTAYITVSRIEDPMKEFLAGKKLINATLGFEHEEFSDKALFDYIVGLTGEDISLLPRNMKPEDGLSFRENTVNGTYNMEVTAADDSDFRLYFRNTDPASFTAYNSKTAPYILPANSVQTSNRKAGFGIALQVNREFATTEDVGKTEIFFIPGVVTQTEFDVAPDYIDVIIPSSAYKRPVDHFFYVTEKWRGSYTISNRFGSSMWVGSASLTSTLYDIWYRMYLSEAE